MSETLKWFKGKINVCVYMPVYPHMPMRGERGARSGREGRRKKVIVVKWQHWESERRFKRSLSN